MTFSIKTVGIVGTGQMGTGIAQVFLKHSYTVFLYDRDANALEKAHQKIKKFFEKNPTSLASETIAKNIQSIQNLSELQQCDIVIEATTENFDIKTQLLKEIELYLKPEAVLLTNTSSLSLNQLAICLKVSERFMGMHFMNPVPVISLVELIKADKTSAKTVQIVAELVQKIGKTAVYSTDTPGFIVNRILIPMLHEAMMVLEAGVGSATDIDTAMCLGTNQPLGPLALADLIGLDTCLAIMQTLEKDLKSDKYKPCPLLISMVEKGFLGRKTKKGFHTY